MDQSKIWKGNWTFVLAAAGAAVGLGNIWKFPYLAGESGGGAFVIVYLLCILLLGLPIMIAEIYIGRYGRKSPINSVKRIINDFNLNKLWLILGWLGALAGLLILSYYSVIAGIAASYIFSSIPASELNPAEYSVEHYSNFKSSPLTMIFWHSLFIGVTCYVVGKGVVDGIGRAINILMPILFFLVIVLCIYSSITGEFIKTFTFLFNPDFSKITPEVVITAMGQAFFTLSIGMGSIMAYGAYMPQEQMIGKTVLIVIFLDTLVALLAGFTIFPIVFSNPELSAFVGKGLLFESLPVAFHSMPLGTIFHSIFFILVSIAALSSSVSLIEPFTAWIEEEKIFSRLKGVIILGLIAWFIGLGTVFSDNIWANYEISGLNFFEWTTVLTDQFMLPLGGLLICLLVGFFIPKLELEKDLSLSGNISKIFSVCLKIVAPLSVLLIFGYALS